MLARVSNIEVYRKWINWRPRFEGDVEPTLDQIVNFIKTGAPPAEDLETARKIVASMDAGTAFHAAIETATDGDHEAFEAMGYRFILPDAEIALPSIRELRGFKDYGALTVSGKVDCLEGKTVIDHKTTKKVDFDRFLEGCQWRFYLDIFEAEIFRWHIFEIKEVSEKVYEVKAPQTLEARRYPELDADCARLADDFLEFAHRVGLPDSRLDDAA